MGILYINKPKGITSFDVCYKLRKVLNTKKIGHTGTLDPNATGVMIVLFDKDTKANQFLVSEYKEYVATALLGIETDTLDIDGKVINQKNEKMPSIDEIKAVLSSYKRVYEQMPPLTSAIKINGKKLYEYQREGKEVVIQPRKVEIKEIELLDVNDKTFTFKCFVSSGTYIRSLLKDILNDLNVIGTLKELERTKINDINLNDCDSLIDVENGNYRLHNLYDVLSKKYYVYNVLDAKPIMDGKPIKTNLKQEEILVCKDQMCLAIYKKDKDIFRSVRGLF